MIYRMRIYRTEPDAVDVFNAFFRDRLLPVQLRYGARLVGRWQTDDGRIVAVWEYDSREEYERIQASVAADPNSISAQEDRRRLPPLFSSMEEVFMEPTVDVSRPTTPK